MTGYTLLTDQFAPVVPAPSPVSGGITPAFHFRRTGAWQTER